MHNRKMYSEQGRYVISICYSMGRSDMRDIFHELKVLAAVKSHEAKLSAISPLYRKQVEYIPEFHNCSCYNILIPWLLHSSNTPFSTQLQATQRGRYITFFTLVGDISGRQVIFHVDR